MFYSEFQVPKLNFSRDILCLNIWTSSYLPANEGVMAFVCGFGETSPDELWLDVDAFRCGDECWEAWFWKLLKCCWWTVTRTWWTIQMTMLSLCQHQLWFVQIISSNIWSGARPGMCQCRNQCQYVVVLDMCDCRTKYHLKIFHKYFCNSGHGKVPCVSHIKNKWLSHNSNSGVSDL